MLQLRNETPFAAALFLFPDARGVDTLYVVVKSTFALHEGAPRVADAQVAVALADEFHDAPERSSLKTASEAHLARPGTDVLVTGSVHAPRGRAVATCDAHIAVGPLRTTIRAVGDRELTGSATPPYFTPALPFTAMPLRYERAFGGTLRDAQTGRTQVDRRNPVGRGLLPPDARDLRPFKGTALPNLEDPGALWQRPGDRPRPMATGPIAPAWLPRAQYAGTYDAAWETRRAPYLPSDFDARYFHIAPPHLVSEAALQGGEPVSLEGLRPDGPSRFALPALRLEADAVVGRARHPLQFALETVHLEPDDGRVVLVHRAALACDKRVMSIETVRLAIASLALGAAS